MARRRREHGFTALRVQGGILPPDFLYSIASLEAPRQTGADYGLSKSLVLKEELGRYWRMCSDSYADYARRRRRSDLNPHIVGVDNWLVPLLHSSLGYQDLTRSSKSVEVGDRVFKLTHRAWGYAVPLLLVTRDCDLDRADPRFGYEGLRQAPHALMQEYLNAEDASLWGIVSNGSKIRILRDNPSMTRPSYIEADLDLIFEEELYPDFAALWLAVHASRLQPSDHRPSSCIMETWRAKALETGERARESLRDGVTQALRHLGNGFLQHPDNTDLQAALHNGSISPDRYFQQLLRLIYRLLFLFTAEERNLLHIPASTDQQRAIYGAGFSLSRLRERALRRRSYDQHHDLWQGLLITFRALARGELALGLPALGGLFQVDQCLELDQAAITNERLLEAIRVLSFFQTGRGLTRVNYRDMDTEELGSVYESLLELQPVVEINGKPWNFGFIGDGDGQKTKGSQRKLTGSYYTPPALVGELIKSALEPVLDEAVADHPEDPRAAILNLKVLDPACGSGHFLLAAARRMALEIARLESYSDTVDETVRQHALREVVQRCIYGVDKNPLAVELCKAALWIETVEPGKPLTFLDSHIRLGDSLIGILDPEVMVDGIPGEAYKPLTGDDKVVCRSLKKRNRWMGDAPQFSMFDEDSVFNVALTVADIERMPEETLEDVLRKSAAWDEAQAEETLRREELRANLFMGAYFATKTPETEATVPHTEDFDRLQMGMHQRPGVDPLVTELADQYTFFHWHLAFAEIMQSGGFDVVLGNPPWDQIQLDPREFFANKNRAVAEQPNMAARKRAIQGLADSDPHLYFEYQAAVIAMNRVKYFIHSSGRFPKTSYGRLNSAPLFAELVLSLLSPRGRAGVVIPTGIATDAFNQYFFNHLIDRESLVSLYDFENREKVFPGIDSRIKFCLITLTGSDRPRSQAEFAFFLHQTEQLKEQERRFKLSAEDFALFKPNTRTCPIFRGQRDMEIAQKMYRRAGIFWKEAKEGQPEVNPWGVKLQLMFMMNTDSHLFRTREQMEKEGWKLYGNVFVRDEEIYLPLYEAKLFHQYDHRFATFDGVNVRDRRNGRPLYVTADQKADPDTVILPRYWVPELEVLERLDKGPQTPDPRPQTPDPRPQTHYTSPVGSSISSPIWRATRYPKDNECNQRTNGDLHDNAKDRLKRFRKHCQLWSLVFRDITNATNQRTSIVTVIPRTAVSNKGPIIKVNHSRWLQALRNITNATNERTVLSGQVPLSGVGHSGSLLDYEAGRAVSSALMVANMNSIPFDWAARLSVGGSNMNFFIVKQLPVLPPESYLESVNPWSEIKWVELVVPRVLELTYTAHELEGFARDLGYDGPPFPWDDEHRHRLRCELDAIFAHMYRLDRSDLEWILDAPPPSSSFPSLKGNEINRFGEYRTKRYVLHAFDQITLGKPPDLTRE